MKATIKAKNVIISMVIAVAVIALTIPSHIVQAATLTPNRGKATIAIGESVQCSVGSKLRNVEWSSRNTAIATVNRRTGLVRGRSSGTAIIQAKVNRRIYSFQISVDDPQLETEKIELKIGETYDLSVLGSERIFDYTSNDEDIAEVNDSGEIHAIDLGETEIIVSSGKTELVCLVYVVD